MNEKEAIEQIRKKACNNRCLPSMCNDGCMYGEEKCAFSVAIKALEEVQQYRKNHLRRKEMEEKNVKLCKEARERIGRIMVKPSDEEVIAELEKEVRYYREKIKCLNGAKGKKMRVYISGPITGTDDYMERFAKAEEELKKAGYSVMNPAKVNSMMPGDTTYEEYMRMSFTMLDMCGGICMLDGWEKSRGANREYGYALAKNYEFNLGGKADEH